LGEYKHIYFLSPSAAVAKGRGSGGQRLLARPDSRGRCIVDQGQKTPFFSPPKKHRTAEEINSSFLGRTVTQVSGQMLKGSPSTQQAALSILADLAMPDNNVSKIIVSSKASSSQQEDHKERVTLYSIAECFIIKYIDSIVTL